MLFHEIYGVYVQAITHIVNASMQSQLTQADIIDIIHTYAFPESELSILPALTKQQYQLLDEQLHTPLRHPSHRPLSLLEKRWIKALLQDPMIKLFLPDQYEELGLTDVTPLFHYHDLYVFDACADADRVEDVGYIARFHMLLYALHEQRQVWILYQNATGRLEKLTISPCHLEYSQKDQKFRLRTTKRTFNVSRIIECELRNQPVEKSEPSEPQIALAVMEIKNERDTLTRCMLHFAHFKKETRQIADGVYQMKLWYHVEDESEVLIRILSFGPFLKVREPSSLLSQIKERLHKQKNCRI